jgi:hypothetical protein
VIGVPVFVPERWVVTAVVPGQREILQSYPENKYVGGRDGDMTKEYNQTDQASSRRERGTRAYPPSWLDHLADWVERLPGPSWPYYLGLGLVLVLIEAIIRRRIETNPIGGFLYPSPHEVIQVVGTAFFLAGLHYLDKVAEEAMNELRPALDVSEEEYRDLCYRLTNLPARATLFVSIFFAAYAAQQILTTPGVFPGLFTSSAAVIQFILLLGTGSVQGVGVYHTIHQLILVNRIHTSYTQVKLFELDPLYAFSGLTARTALILSIAPSALLLVAPEETELPSAIAFIVLAVTVFALPLLGIHNRLAEEKKRWLAENAKRLEAAITELHRRMDAQELEGIGDLRTAMSCLEVEHDALARIPTWPWQPGTLRGLFAAILFPLMVSIIQWILQRVLGL